MERKTGKGGCHFSYDERKFFQEFRRPSNGRKYTKYSFQSINKHPGTQTHHLRLIP